MAAMLGFGRLRRETGISPIGLRRPPKKEKKVNSR